MFRESHLLVFYVLIPKSSHQIASNAIPGVLGNQSDDEASVSTKIFVDELATSVVQVRCDTIEFNQSVFDVVPLESDEYGDDDPLKETERRDDENENDPEPEEDEHHFVEKVHR
jgi:hypothetical protein